MIKIIDKLANKHPKKDSAVISVKFKNYKNMAMHKS
jgi:hypothetical protein